MPEKITNDIERALERFQVGHEPFGIVNPITHSWAQRWSRFSGQNQGLIKVETGSLNLY